MCLCAIVSNCHSHFQQITLFTSNSLQNFLFTTRDEDAPMKVIDFGLSDFIRTGNGCVHK